MISCAFFFSWSRHISLFCWSKLLTIPLGIGLSLLWVINMLINEVSKATNLTKKAIEYYVKQGLIFPGVLENGYRDFNKTEVECLEKISVLRKLGMSIEEIKAILADTTGCMIQKASVQKELNMQREQAKKAILDKLGAGTSYTDILPELGAIEQSTVITEKLLEAFPGYYGRFICLHFGRFLNEIITTDEQQMAYQEMIAFLDNIPPLDLPKDLQDYLMESTNDMNTQHITDMLNKLNQAYQDPDTFLSDNHQMLADYLIFKQSDEYKNSPAYKMLSLLKEFNQTNGYYDLFIPAMKRLSTSYASYYSQIEIANRKWLEHYPEMFELNN